MSNPIGLWEKDDSPWLSRLLRKIYRVTHETWFTKMLGKGNLQHRTDKYNMDVGFHIGLSEVYLRLCNKEPLDLDEIKQALDETLKDITDFEDRTRITDRDFFIPLGKIKKGERRYNLSDQLRKTV
jgi:hypothetical protein